MLQPLPLDSVSVLNAQKPVTYSAYASAGLSRQKREAVLQRSTTIASSNIYIFLTSSLLVNAKTTQDNSS